MVSLKACRSSPRLMASTLTPMTLHAVLRRGRPRWPELEDRFSPVWPPRLGSRASGRSLSMISRQGLPCSAARCR